MSMTDPIADLLTRIRNALIAKHDRLELPSSQLKVNLCKLLEREGFIKGFRVHDRPPAKAIEIFLHYDREGAPAITSLRRVSKPGRRVYRGAEEIKPVLNGIGVAIVSTPQGLLTDTEARQRRVGGEVMCEIY
ncbi:MAG TPA: 30S ribosomal protein S8 [Thermoanaerobaculia bacterium]|nr:30S ribosomal protein S8 [Thermoanaerobaculia bacterium]